jgi:hypothetical protein
MRRRNLFVVAALALLTTLALAAVTSATVSPSSATMTLRAGDPVLGHDSETKLVGVPPVPPRADIEIAIDTTSSMNPSITQAKADATAIVTGVQAVVPDTQFAVVDFRDAGDTPEYLVRQSMTASAAAVQTAINAMAPGGGGDFPEAYNLVYRNSYVPAVGGSIGWRADTRKFVIVIGDASPHGAGSAGVPGCTDTSADPNGLNTATELAGMKAAERTLFMILQTSSATTSLACYQGLAAGAFAGGQGVTGGTNLSAQIVSLIQAAFANVSDVHLEVAAAAPAPASASWIAFSPASVGPVPAPSNQTFTVTATVPAGTPAGTYVFDIVANADGVDIGHQALTIVVPVKQMTLTPATDSNPIGTSHTVTAHVFDALGSFVGDTVTFGVAGIASVPAGGSATTDAGGLASFTFTNTPPAPGTNTITATDGALVATATKTWINEPPSCAGLQLDVTRLWPANHKLWTITASGAADSDIGDAASVVIDGVTQDEPVDAAGNGDGNTSPDAFLTTPVSNKAQVRAERAGTGDGRVYRLHVTATDTHGATCSGTLRVGVPHDQGGQPVPFDSAPPSFDSLLP